MQQNLYGDDGQADAGAPEPKNRAEGTDGAMWTLARQGAAHLLRGLIDTPIRTVTGRINIILDVRPPDVLVGTGKSPDGKPVKVALVENALQTLITTGSVEIHPIPLGIEVRSSARCSLPYREPPPLRAVRQPSDSVKSLPQT